MELASKLADTAKQLSDLEKQLDLLSKDQARLRENLKIIPMTSEHYKKFLEKFVGHGWLNLAGGCCGMASPSERGSDPAKLTSRLVSRTTASP